ncbi:MAG: hypothetical protein HY075_02700 [Deltaproteobacteria bacterium]|nr:hypothetical protein [Deltaproteobacteria bacterium]
MKNLFLTVALAGALGLTGATGCTDRNDGSDQGAATRVPSSQNSAPTGQTQDAQNTQSTQNAQNAPSSSQQSMKKSVSVKKGKRKSLNKKKAAGNEQSSNLGNGQGNGQQGDLAKRNDDVLPRHPSSPGITGENDDNNNSTNEDAEVDDLSSSDRQPSSRDMVCDLSSKHEHPLFLREDLAYSVTGVDCFGDKPEKYGNTPTDIGRKIASECRNDPHAHPLYLRSDMEYSITGHDCTGDLPNESSFVPF